MLFYKVNITIIQCSAFTGQCWLILMDFAIVIYIVAINTVNPIFLTLLYFSDMETHQNLKSFNFDEQR